MVFKGWILSATNVVELMYFLLFFFKYFKLENDFFKFYYKFKVRNLGDKPVSYRDWSRATKYQIKLLFKMRLDIPSS